MIDYRNQPTQERAGLRVQQILSAASAHYQQVGRDHFNTREVAAAAGCSIGTVYRYFHDKIQLLDAIAPDRDAADDRVRAGLSLLEREPETLDVDLRRLVVDTRQTLKGIQ